MAGTPTLGSSALKAEGRYTIADYKTWPDNERWELIHGEAYAMSPAPKSSHQRVVGELYYHLKGFLKGKPCEPFVSPIDVFLPKDLGEPDTVVQPDILVVCDPDKVHEDGIHGAPTFVVEILSDSTAYKDLNEKKDLYEAQGVQEYWVVKPSDGSVLAWRLSGTRYAPLREYRGDEPVDSTSLAGFQWEPRAKA